MTGTIYVSQGSHESVGIEVFLKSFSCLNSKECEQFHLVCNRDSLEEHLEKLRYTYQLKDDVLHCLGSKLKVTFTQNEGSIGQQSLDSILKSITPDDVLLTLPMSKDELFHKKELCSGHTAYLRKYFNKDFLPMFFMGHQDRTLLLTDHIPLVKVNEHLNSETITKKIQVVLDFLTAFYHGTDELIISGVNPHAGENGLLGKGEDILKASIDKVQKMYSKLRIKGPLPSDTIYRNRNLDIHQLFVFSYHDQGLNIFKERNRFKGANITLGLPFLRLSVDHGTAPDIVWKNVANYQGALFVMKYSLNYLKKRAL